MVGDEGEETNALVSESTRTKWVVRRPIDIIMVDLTGLEPIIVKMGQMAHPKKGKS